MRSVAVFWCNAEPNTAGTAKNASALRRKMHFVADFYRNAEGVIVAFFMIPQSNVRFVTVNKGLNTLLSII